MQNSHTNVPSPLLSLAAKTVDDVLRRFGETIEEARINYRNFVEKGIALGRRPEFQGGGLIRSMGGKKTAFIELKRGNVKKSDQRILGSGSFACPVKPVFLLFHRGKHDTGTIG